jgi:hypothetical protein
VTSGVRGTAVGVLVGLLVLAGLHAVGFLPLPPLHLTGQLHEFYLKGQKPETPNVTGVRVARSDQGLVIGVGRPGYVEWRFPPGAASPSIVQPYFLPSVSHPARILRVSPTETRVLVNNRPWRNRALRLDRPGKESGEFSVRFEGQDAWLREIYFFQSPDALPGAAVPLMALGLLAVWIFFHRRNPNLIVLGIVVCAGFLIRWPAYLTHYRVPLGGDAEYFWQLAREWNWHAPFSTGTREPGFIWLVKAALVLFGDSQRSARFLGLGLSCGVLVMIYRIALSAGWGARVGLVAAGLFACNPFAVYMSVQGYQLEFYTFLILLFSDLWLRRDAFGMGWAGGFLSITRVESFFAVVPLVLVGAWRGRWKSRQSLAAVLAFLVLFLPYAVRLTRTTGSVFGRLHGDVGWYFSAEIKGDPSQAGSLPKISFWNYLFIQHKPASLIAGTVKGYAQVLFNPMNAYNRIYLNSHDARAWNLLLWPFYLWGLGRCLMRSQDRWFLALPLCFLSGLPMFEDLFREPRLLFHVAPFVALFAARGLSGAFSVVSARLSRRDKQSTF